VDWERFWFDLWSRLYRPRPELIKAIARASEMLIPVLKGKYDEEWNIAAFGLLIISS